MADSGERAIRSVAVLGGGIVGLSAALAFARALPRVAVRVIEIPPDPAALTDRVPGSWPLIARFHAAIGLDEADVLRAGAATFKLGTRFEGGPGGGAPWYQVHGQTGFAAGSIPFHQLWARARRAGAVLPFDQYSAAAVLAQAGKFVHPEGDPRSPLSSYDYALRLDPARYAALLRALAVRRGLVVAGGALAGVERRDDGGVAALRLADGQRVAADLFLDCAGPGATLLGALDDGFEDWSAGLPRERLLIDAAPHVAATSRDTVRWSASGWEMRAALPGYEQRVTAGGANATGGIALRPGRRVPWCRNVLALGDAALVASPLPGTALYLAHAAILRALEMLPGRDCHPLELAEYNRRAGLEGARVLDFHALHYRAAGRPVPDGLAHDIEQFTRRGRVPTHDEDPFPRESWIGALIGTGVLPGHTDPLAAGVDAAESAAAMQRLADGLATVPGQLPEYARYLRLRGAPG